MLNAAELKRRHASPQGASASTRGHASSQDASAPEREAGGEPSGAGPGQAPDAKGGAGQAETRGAGRPGSAQGEPPEQGGRRHGPGRGPSKEAVGPEMSISIPLPLKKQLVADEKMIVHKGEVRPGSGTRFCCRWFNVPFQPMPFAAPVCF